MHPLSTCFVVFGAALAAISGAAGAHPCYVLLDAKDVVLYRQVMPPVDMSNRGAAEREALRKTGVYLLIIDVEDCVSLGFGSAWASVAAAPLAEVTSNIQSITESGEGAVSRAPGIQPARRTAATPSAASAPPAARQRTPGPERRPQ